MPNFNNVQIMGHLTKDPQLGYTRGGKPFVRFALAVNRKWKDQQGQPHEEATFVDCCVWAKLAEIVNKFCKKGDPLFVAGFLKQERWEKDGKKHSRLSVMGDTIQLLNRRQPAPTGGGQFADDPEGATIPYDDHR